MQFSQLRVLITREPNQAAPLAKKINAQGGRVFYLPTIEILPAHNQQALKQQLNTLAELDIAIFTSANAVPAVAKQWHTTNQTLATIAIGPATQAAAKQYGIDIAHIATPPSSEGLLNHPLLHSINGKRIGIFCGENSRPLLTEGLQQRQAIVEKIECYRRERPQYSFENLIAVKQNHINLIISLSPDSLRNLQTLFTPIDPTWLQTIPLIVISEKMHAIANEFGFRQVIRAPDTAADSILQVIPV